MGRVSGGLQILKGCLPTTNKYQKKNQNYSTHMNSFKEKLNVLANMHIYMNSDRAKPMESCEFGTQEISKFLL